MNKLIPLALVLALFWGVQAFGSEHQVIDTLGASAKGQFVALEEYGYRRDRHIFYVTIKIINVWTNEYVSPGVNVEYPAYKTDHLIEARAKARFAAQDELLKYKISG